MNATARSTSVTETCMSTTRYNVCLVGLGRIGVRGFGDPDIETHSEAILAHPHLKLCVGVDTSEDARRAFQTATGVRAYAALADALKAERPQIVSICTPQSTHMLLTEIAYATITGVVIGEKPMAESVPQCERMIAAAAGRPLLIAHQRRYERRHRYLRSLLKRGVLGKPMSGIGNFSGDYLNNGTHAVDTMRFLLGDDTPFSIRRRMGDIFSAWVGCEQGSVVLDSYGKLWPGYMSALYDDAIECLDTGKRPECSGDDGLEAVRLALAAERGDQAREVAA